MVVDVCVTHGDDMTDYQIGLMYEYPDLPCRHCGEKSGERECCSMTRELRKMLEIHGVSAYKRHEWGVGKNSDNCLQYMCSRCKVLMIGNEGTECKG
jgi:hypothetical protein